MITGEEIENIIDLEATLTELVEQLEKTKMNDRIYDVDFVETANNIRQFVRPKIAKAVMDKIGEEEFNTYIVNSKIKDIGNGFKERTITIKKVQPMKQTLEKEIHNLKNQIEILETDKNNLNFKNCIKLNKLLIKENTELKKQLILL